MAMYPERQTTNTYRMKKIARLASKNFFRDYQIYLLILPSILVIFIFNYIPMYGIQIAFKDFRFKEGIVGSQWVGLKHFFHFLTMDHFWLTLKNTVTIQLYSLIIGFPAPILLAILLNECVHRKFKKAVQMISYAPYFISTVVMCGMILLFTNNNTGVINNIMALLGFQRINFMIEPKWFQTVYVFSGVWQGVGWSSIIYLAAMSGIDPELIEAAVIDGANRFQKIWHIDLSSIAPTIIILLIFSLASLLGVGFEKILLLQNSLNMEASDVISTYVYRIGLIGAQYSFTTAIGLFNTLVSFLLLVIVNFIAKRLSDVSLF
ncbi:MAG: ABC transporter permease subunit [Bacillota bacterium]|nr:ABC transporter permease subunit [Bacillota bacterium]